LTFRPLIAVASLVLAAGCGGSGDSAKRPAVPVPAGARVGVDPIPAVHVLENHSSALIAWRLANVRDHVLVHLDRSADLDWLPDVTVARVAAADPDELAKLEAHPYAIDGEAMNRFGNGNFVYPAARLGLIRELAWVVPDGTLADSRAAEDLVRNTILGKIQMIPLDEARTLHFEGRTIRGSILGLRVVICELNDLPAYDEPVLLDVDLDYLAATPSLAPSELVARLSRRKLRADMATISRSTIGGFVRPQQRWLGPALQAALERAPDADAKRWARRAEADAAYQAGNTAAAVAAWRELAASHPEDGSVWYALAAAADSGHAAAGAADLAKAVAADPVLDDAPLFEADALRLGQKYGEAFDRYRDYRRALPSGPYLAYALSREAECLTRMGRNDDAIATLRKVIVMAPDHADTRLDLGVLLRDRGDLPGAVEQLAEARKLRSDVAAYAMALGIAYAKQEKFGEAVDALEDAVLRRPSWAEARVNLGLVLTRAGRPVDAAEQFDTALTLEPRDPEIARLAGRLKRRGTGTTEVVAHP
jgi:tetratricopeptide (TPR) repeat protein